LIAEIPYCASILCSSDVSAAPDSIIDLFPGLDIHNAAGGSTGGKPSQYCSIGFWQTTGALLYSAISSATTGENFSYAN
jgi:hypothetical protein